MPYIYFYWTKVCIWCIIYICISMYKNEAGAMMETRIYKIGEDISESEYDYIKEAAGVIRDGGLVAFPTETVYGLGGDALNPESSRRIYGAKGRPSDNPLIVHIADFEDIYPLARKVPDIAVILAEKFWPGPLTMILKKSGIVPYETTGGLDTVAVRLPDNRIACALIREAGVPVAAPSANRSGKPSPTTAQHVYGDLSGKIDVILDGGAVSIGIESTIIDLTGDIPVILRPGYINQDMLNDILGDVARDPAIDNKVEGDIKPKAPGMMYRHYAPEGELMIVEGEISAVSDKINELAGMYDESVVGIITTTENRERYDYGTVVCIGSRENEITIAHNLYAALRKMDECKIKHIFIEGFSNEGLGDAIMNRIMKAAGHKVLKV